MIKNHDHYSTKLWLTGKKSLVVAVGNVTRHAAQL